MTRGAAVMEGAEQGDGVVVEVMVEVEVELMKFRILNAFIPHNKLTNATREIN